MSCPLRPLLGLILAAGMAAGETDALAAALRLEDGDAFAADRMMEALYTATAGSRRPLVERIAASARADIDDVLVRMVQDEDASAAATAIDALARRWPTRMQDADLIRMMIQRNGPAADAACRYAAAIRDDEALQVLVDRNGARPADKPSEDALRSLLGLPGGCGPEGWQAIVDARRAEVATALAKAERLLEGASLDAIAAVTLIAGMRPVGSPAALILLRATEHPDRAVRDTAASILTTCSCPPAAAWRRNLETARQQAVADAETTTDGPPAEPPWPTPAASATATAAAIREPATAETPRGSSSAAWLLLAGGAGAALLVAMWAMRRRRAAAVPAPAGGRITWAR